MAARVRGIYGRNLYWVMGKDKDPLMKVLTVVMTAVLPGPGPNRILHCIYFPFPSW